MKSIAIATVSKNWPVFLIGGGIALYSLLVVVVMSMLNCVQQLSVDCKNRGYKFDSLGRFRITTTGYYPRLWVFSCV